jgi:RNA chaperone Hfq
MPTTTEKKQNLQDTFLNSVRKSKTPLTIFLVNGVKLQGVVSWFDNFCVLLRRDGQSQLPSRPSCRLNRFSFTSPSLIRTWIELA